jgi:hypothetical protein
LRKRRCEYPRLIVVPPAPAAAPPPLAKGRGGASDSGTILKAGTPSFGALRGQRDTPSRRQATLRVDEDMPRSAAALKRGRWASWQRVSGVTRASLVRGGSTGGEGLLEAVEGRGLVGRR